MTEGSLQTMDSAISPDGERLAFCSSGETQEDIFVSRSDGTDRRQLTNDLFKDRLPRWSPDGQRIAFQSNRSGTWEIWLINGDGSGLRELTFTSDYAVFPTWSPDGSRLAYSARAEHARIHQLDRPWAEQVQPKSKAPDDTRTGLIRGPGHLMAGAWPVGSRVCVTREGSPFIPLTRKRSRSFPRPATSLSG